MEIVPPVGKDGESLFMQPATLFDDLKILLATSSNTKSAKISRHRQRQRLLYYSSFSVN